MKLRKVLAIVLVVAVLAAVGPHVTMTKIHCISDRKMQIYCSV